MDSLGRNSEFNIADLSLLSWLAEIWTKRWPTVSQQKTPSKPWFNVEEGIQSIRDSGLLEWLYYLRPTYPYWEGPQDIIYEYCVKFVRGGPVYFKCSLIAIFYRPDLRLGTEATQLRNLNTLGVNWIWRGRSQMASFSHQKQGGPGCYNRWQSQSSSQNRMICIALWH